MFKKKIKIPDLAPVDNLGRHNKYVETLLNKHKNDNVRNIAVVGPYGCGKSSVVRSYMKFVRGKALYFSQESLFKYEKNDKNNSLLLTIYKELLKYDTSSKVFKNIIDSYFSKSLIKIILSIGIIIAEILLGLLIGHFLFRYISYLSILVSVSVILLLLYLYYSFSIREFKVKTKNLELNASANQINNVFEHPTYLENALLVELKQNDIRYIVIEDLERVVKKESETFTKGILGILEEFKILSDLVKRSKIIRHKVEFIFGLNDSCFVLDEERAKYFDFILPVLPKITSANASSILFNDERLSKNGVEKEVIVDIGVFVNNLRIANAIISQFLLHKSVIQKDITPTKLFVLDAFNVLFPKVYFDISEDFNNNLLENIFKDIKSNNDITKIVKEKVDAIYSNEKEPYKEKLVLFVSMCLKNKYILRNYKMYFCEKFINCLDENDIALQMKNLGGVSVLDDTIDDVETVIALDSNNGFIKNPNVYVISNVVQKNITDKIGIFKNCFETNYTEEQKSKILDFLLKDLDQQSIYNFLEKFGNSTVFLTSFLKIDNKQTFEKASPAFAYYYFSNVSKSDSNAEKFISAINNSHYIEDYVAYIPNILSVFISISKFKPVFIQQFNHEHMDIIRSSSSYEINRNNIDIIFNDYTVNTLQVISSNTNITKNITVKNAKELFEGCIINYSEENLILLKKIFDEISVIEVRDEILQTSAFDSWKFNVKVSDALKISYFKTLFRNNLVVLDDESYVQAINKAFVLKTYFEDNINQIKTHCKKLSGKWINFIFNDLDDYLFDEIKDILPNIEKENLSGISNYKRLAYIFKKFNSNIILQYLLTNFANDTIESIKHNELVRDDFINVELTDSFIDLLITNNLNDFYNLFIEKQNALNFKRYLQTHEDFFSYDCFKKDGKMCSCDDMELLIWFCSNKNNSFETISYVVDATDPNLLNDAQWKKIIINFSENQSERNIKYLINDSSTRFLKKFEISQIISGLRIKYNFYTFKFNAGPYKKVIL